MFGRGDDYGGTVEPVNRHGCQESNLQIDKAVNQFDSVHANLADDQKSQATSLSKGATISLVCESVSEVIGTPILKDCKIS